MTLHKLPSFILPVLALGACDAAAPATDAPDTAELSELGKADLVHDAVALSLSPIDTTALVSMRDAYNADCGDGYTWCALDSVEGFALSQCPDTRSFDAIVEHLQATHPAFANQQGAPDGKFLTRAEMVTAFPFSAYYTDVGPQLLEALDTLASSVAVEGWQAWSEVPCHNCTEVKEIHVAYYPAAGYVFVLQGNYGYDS